MKWNADRLLCAAALVAAAGIAAVGFSANRDYYSDDSFIGLRYARNFVSGHGLVWNPGERVEGYSNGLYTLLEAFLAAAHVDLVAASRVISLLAFLTIVLFVWLRSPRLRGPGITDDAPALGPLVLVLTSFPLIVWTRGGLEGPWFALWIAIATWLLKETLGRDLTVRRLAASGSLYGLACATRMDGLLFVAMSLFFLLLESRETRLRRLGIFTAAFSIVYLPYYLWRLSYYGTLLPNTFWVKAAGFNWGRLDSGLLYVRSYAATPPYLGALAVLALLCPALLGSFDRGLAYLFSVIAVYASYVAYVGGDHMPAFRLLLPAIPLTALLVEAALASARPRIGRSTGRAILVCLLVLSGLQTGDSILNPRTVDAATFVGTIVGQHIASRWPRGSLVALNTAGSPPFYAGELRFVDMLGLNDAHIARRPVAALQLPWQSVPGHAKGDGAYVLSRRPDYIIIGPAEGATAGRPSFLSDLEISRDPRFSARYALRQEQFDVSDRTGFERYAATRTGILTFTYYERSGQGE